jgi:hypothetical protein
MECDAVIFSIELNLIRKRLAELTQSLRVLLTFTADYHRK